MSVAGDAGPDSPLRALPAILTAAEAAADRAVEQAAAAGPVRPDSLFHADNLDVLAAVVRQGIPIDLIYVDPPFASGAAYSVVARGERAPAPGFPDRWRGGLNGYLAMLAPRVMLMRRALAETGSVYVHVDWHASHWVRVLLDEVFGRDAFCNEIVWLYGLGGSSPRRWPRKHDTIFWYARTAGAQYFVPDLVPATSARLRGALKKAPDYWDIPAINNQARERTGYPTQKPAALLERIVRSSSADGALVADFFAGSGTTAAVAQSLGRRWIAVDSGEAAVSVAGARLGVPPRRLG